MAIDEQTFAELSRAVSQFVREQLVPLESTIEQADAMPPSVVAKMRELGLFGLTIPVRYGGLGLSLFDEMRLVFEFGWTSPAFHSVFGGNNGIAGEGLIIAGTETQKQAYLPKLASGEFIGAFAMTEPEAGSDAAGLRCTARKVANGWWLSGTKRYITNAPIANLFTVLARTDPDQRAGSAISAFLVEANTPGMTLGLPDKKMGHRGSPTCDVILDNCFVADTAMLGNEGEGLKLALQVVDRGRLRVAALCVGIAERLIHDIVHYALQRKQFGRPIVEFQLVAAMLADSKAEAYASRCMVLDAARRGETEASISTEAACAKMFCSEMAGRVADRAVQVYGGAGYIADYGIERFYRDVRLFRLYEGTTQIQQLVIARNMVKAAQFGA